MVGLAAKCPGYGELDDWDGAWRRLATEVGAEVGTAGRSVEGRDILRLDFGPADGPSVLLTGLIHGIELIGGLALLELVRKLSASAPKARFTVLPAVNPDAVSENVARLRAGRRAGRRSNRRGVDLNRNFARLGPVPRHPFAGSTRPGRFYYIGEKGFSEPETRAVAEVATEIRPRLALGFHSFGRMLLYPWAHTRRPHPRTEAYRDLGAAFLEAQGERRYDLRPAHALYPTVGDLDDWLDAEFGTFAYTVEVSTLCRRLLDPRRLLNPFHWMNPLDPAAAVAPAAEGSLALVERFLASEPRAGAITPLRRRRSAAHPPLAAY